MQKKTNGAKLKLIKAQAVAQMLRQCSSVNEILEEIRCSFKKEREEKEMKKGLKRLFGGLGNSYGAVSCHDFARG